MGAGRNFKGDLDRLHLQRFFVDLLRDVGSFLSTVNSLWGMRVFDRDRPGPLLLVESIAPFAFLETCEVFMSYWLVLTLLGGMRFRLLFFKACMSMLEPVSVLSRLISVRYFLSSSCFIFIVLNLAIYRFTESSMNS